MDHSCRFTGRARVCLLLLVAAFSWGTAPPGWHAIRVHAQENQIGPTPAEVAERIQTEWGKLTAEDSTDVVRALAAASLLEMAEREEAARARLLEVLRASRDGAVVRAVLEAITQGGSAPGLLGPLAARLSPKAGNGNGNGEEKEAVIRAVGALLAESPESTCEALVRLLVSGKPEAAQAGAAQALEALLPDAALPHLLAAWRDREGCSDAAADRIEELFLAYFATRGHPVESERDREELVQLKLAEVQRNAAAGSWQALCDDLLHRYPEVAEAAAGALRALHRKEATAPLLEAFRTWCDRNSSPTTARAMLGALAACGAEAAPEEAGPVAAGLLQDDRLEPVGDPELRLAVLDTIVELPGGSQLPGLSTHLLDVFVHETNQSHRIAMVDLLASVKDPAHLPALLQASDGGPPELVAKILRTFSFYPRAALASDEQLVGRVLRYVRDEDAGVADAAIAALGHLRVRSPEVRDLLKEVAASPESRASARRQALGFLAEAPEPETITWLVGLLSEPSMGAVLDTLINRVVALVEGLPVDEESREIRRQVITTLLDMSPEAAPVPVPAACLRAAGADPVMLEMLGDRLLPDDAGAAAEAYQRARERLTQAPENGGNGTGSPGPDPTEETLKVLLKLARARLADGQASEAQEVLQEMGDPADWPRPLRLQYHMLAGRAERAAEEMTPEAWERALARFEQAVDAAAESSLERAEALISAAECAEKLGNTETVRSLLEELGAARDSFADDEGLVGRWQGLQERLPPPEKAEPEEDPGG